MQLEALRTLIETTPGPTGPEIDAQARAWLAASGMNVEPGEGDPVVLIVLAVDEDMDFSAFAVPAASLDVAAYLELAEVNRAGFEFHFTGDLAPEQFAGAFRLCGCTTTEPDVFADQIDTLREEVDEQIEGVDYEALLAAAGSWIPYRLTDGARLSGPISHVYSATLSM
jgi:hypothetical protein